MPGLCIEQSTSIEHFPLLPKAHLRHRISRHTRFQLLSIMKEKVFRRRQHLDQMFFELNHLFKYLTYTTHNF